jgi:hypothetical protein
LARLGALGYHVNRIQPLDMFPQTYHIEAIAELTKRSQGSGGPLKSASENTRTFGLFNP